MKSKSIFAALLFLSINVFPVYGELFDCYPLKFDIGASYSRVTMTREEASDYKGNLWGVVASFEHQQCRSFYFDVNALWNEGTLHASNAPRNKVKEGIWDGVIGYTFALGCCDEFSITPYVGLGYRLFKTDTESSLGTPLKIDYKNIFIPLGIKVTYTFCNDWEIGLNGRVMPSIDQRFFVHTVEGVEWKQHRETSYLLELPLTWKGLCLLNHRVSLTLTPFYKYWKLGSSETLDMDSISQKYFGATFTAGIYF